MKWIGINSTSATSLADITSVVAGSALTGGGTTGDVTINHEDTSSQASVDNSGRAFIQDITLDTYGHVTGITSATDSDTYSGTMTGFSAVTDSGSGARYSTSTSAAISILGATGVGVTNSAGVITATAVPSEIDHDSLNNFLAAEHIDWAGASAGTIHSTNIPTLNQDTSGTAATVTGAAQTAITSLGTLTALTVDNITIDGDTITASADLALVATGNDITIDTDTITVESATEHAPRLELKATHTTTTKEGELRFVKDAADTEDGESLGMISFYGEDEGNNQHKFAHIRAKINESDEGAEGGSLFFALATHDGELVNGMQIVEGDVEDEINVSIAHGAASNTTVAGTLTMGSTSTINNSGVIQVAAQTVIDHDQLANFTAAEHYAQSLITEVGTVGTGVWNATKILSPKTTHVIHYHFSGFCSGIASGNFQYGEQYPFAGTPSKLNTDYGNTVIASGEFSDVSDWFRGGGVVMPRAVTAIRMHGWMTCGGSDDVTISLCKVTPTRNTTASVTPVVIATTTLPAINNDKMDFFNVTGSDAGTGTGSIVTSAIAAGDILMMLVLSPNTKTTVFSLTLEVEG